MSSSVSIVMWWSAGSGLSIAVLGVERQAERDRDPAANEPGRRDDPLRREVVERSALGPLAPARPSWRPASNSARNSLARVSRRLPRGPLELALEHAALAERVEEGRAPAARAATAAPNTISTAVSVSRRRGAVGDREALGQQVRELRRRPSPRSPPPRLRRPARARRARAPRTSSASAPRPQTADRITSGRPSVGEAVVDVARVVAQDEDARDRDHARHQPPRRARARGSSARDSASPTPARVADQEHRRQVGAGRDEQRPDEQRQRVQPARDRRRRRRCRPAPARTRSRPTTVPMKNGVSTDETANSALRHAPARGPAARACGRRSPAPRSTIPSAARLSGMNSVEMIDPKASGNAVQQHDQHEDQPDVVRLPDRADRPVDQLRGAACRVSPPPASSVQRPAPKSAPPKTA